jgi:hypothetical protein
VPPVLWALILVDASMLLFLSFFFAVQNPRGHAIIGCVIAVMVSMSSSSRPSRLKPSTTTWSRSVSLQPIRPPRRAVGPRS